MELIIKNSNKGNFNVFLSNEDYDRCKKLKWNIQSIWYKDYEVVYVYTSLNNKSILMHRYILNAKKENVVDHISGNTLDNRRENLRECSNMENCRNRKKNSNSSGHKGIIWYPYKNVNKWMVHIMVDYKKITIGYFEKLEDAIEARKQAEIKYFGEYARDIC